MKNLYIVIFILFNLFLFSLCNDKPRRRKRNKKTEKVTIPPNATATESIELTTYTTPLETTSASAPFLLRKPKKKRIICPYRPGATINDDQTRILCCNHIVKSFAENWYTGGKYLTTHLAILKSWKCPQFKEECERRTFAFNEFSSLVYMHECNAKEMHDKCLSEVNYITESNRERLKRIDEIDDYSLRKSGRIYKPFIQHNITEEEEWRDLVKDIRSEDYELEDLLNPCMQIAIFDSDQSGYGRFHEVVQPFVPFCSFVWCGTDKDTVNRHDISPWTCMPKRCQANLIVAMTAMGLLGLISLIGNVTIIIVFIINHHLRNSQAYYKSTLAFGDLLVGGIVFPTFITSFYFLLVTPHSLGEELRTEDNGTNPIHAPGGHASDNFPRVYLDTVGFFTTFSLFVSVYSLMAASFDRLIAIMRPLAYDKTKSQFVAMIGCIIICVVGAVFAILPYMVKSLKYTLIASILIGSAGTAALILYSVSFIFPLVTVWVTTAATLCYARKHARMRRSISSKKDTFEIRLTKTLAIMVGVFTAVIAPAVIVMLVPFGLSNVFVNDPKQLDQKAFGYFNSCEFVAVIILTSNSLWNVFIYSIRHTEFRSAMANIHRSIFHSISFSTSSRNQLESKSNSRHTGTRALSASSVAQGDGESTNSTIISLGARSRYSLSTLPVEENKDKDKDRKLSEYGITMNNISEKQEKQESEK